MSPCPEAPRKHAISTPVTIILEALRRPSRFPTLPPPTSVVTVTDLLCHCHRPPLSLSPTSFVTVTNHLCPDYPLSPQSPAAASRSTDADCCTSRLYHRPGFRTQKAPHHPEYHPATSGYRLNSVSAPISLPEVFPSGSVRFTRRISRPEVFSSWIGSVSALHQPA